MKAKWINNTCVDDFYITEMTTCCAPMINNILTINALRPPATFFGSIKVNSNEIEVRLFDKQGRQIKYCQFCGTEVTIEKENDEKGHE